MNQIKTIELLDESLIKKSKDNFKYQKKLTNKLDAFSGNFDRNILNEIVLWKVNRYANFDSDTIDLINGIDTKVAIIDKEKTKLLLFSLLHTEGVRLPMASTILRFKNPNVYQIIDQRVYRIIYKRHYNSTFTRNSDKSVKNQVNIYLEYLEKLKAKCIEKNIPFNEADRILYEADKILNKNIKVKY